MAVICLGSADQQGLVSPVFEAEEKVIDKQPARSQPVLPPIETYDNVPTTTDGVRIESATQDLIPSQLTSSRDADHDVSVSGSLLGDATDGVSESITDRSTTNAHTASAKVFIEPAGESHDNGDATVNQEAQVCDQFYEATIQKYRATKFPVSEKHSKILKQESILISGQSVEISTALESVQ